MNGNEPHDNIRRTINSGNVSVYSAQKVTLSRLISKTLNIKKLRDLYSSPGIVRIVTSRKLR
jgi:hypothetical protein